MTTVRISDDALARAGGADKLAAAFEANPSPFAALSALFKTNTAVDAAPWASVCARPRPRPCRLRRAALHPP